MVNDKNYIPWLPLPVLGKLSELILGVLPLIGDLDKHVKKRDEISVHDISFGMRVVFVATTHLWGSCTNSDWLKIKRTIKSNLFP